MSIILWIDPWTTTTWYAIMEKSWNSRELIDFWILETTPKAPLEEKLLELWDDMDYIIDKYKPNLAVIEKLFFTNNIKTWIDVSHARWVVVYKLAKNNIKVKHYTPLELKSAICGHWKATKKQMQNAIKMILKMDDIIKPDDAADAVWLAYLWTLINEKLTD